MDRRMSSAGGRKAMKLRRVSFFLARIARAVKAPAMTRARTRIQPETWSLLR